MKTGDIVFVRGKTIVSDLVRLFDEGEFSHVCLMVSDTHCIEAEWNTRVRITPMLYKDYEVVRPREVDPHLVQHAIQLCGMWYDFKTILGIVLRKPWNNERAFICSEIITTLVYKENVVLKPNELFEYCKNKEIDTL